MSGEERRVEGVAAREVWNPVLRWAGSKRRMIPALLQCAPTTFGTYVEPFAGSACLFFAMRPERAVLGDFNPELIDCYATIRRHPRLVARHVEAQRSTPEAFYAIRAVDPATLDPVERAARFVYLNRHCFNGVYRTNRWNRFNVPYGSRLGTLPSESDFYRCSLALRTAKLSADDFTVTLANMQCGDFAYLDPPYSTSARPNYGEYGYGAFGRTDIDRLAATLTELHSRRVSVLFSFADDPAVREVLKGWSVVSYVVNRRIGGRGTRRPACREILASNLVDIHATPWGTNLPALDASP